MRSLTYLSPLVRGEVRQILVPMTGPGVGLGRPAHIGRGGTRAFLHHRPIHRTDVGEILPLRDRPLARILRGVLAAVIARRVDAGPLHPTSHTRGNLVDRLGVRRHFYVLALELVGLRKFPREEVGVELSVSSKRGPTLLKVEHAAPNSAVSAPGRFCAQFPCSRTYPQSGLTITWAKTRCNLPLTR